MNTRDTLYKQVSWALSNIKKGFTDTDKITFLPKTHEMLQKKNTVA